MPKKPTKDTPNDNPEEPIVEKITQTPIVEEMESSYIDYAMSVIVARALPDVRDGLKPVHRRILYAMWTIGLKSTAKFRKSATVVGEVLGKYHPHGDQAVYDSMVRMAQDFSMRYQLVHGQGNFGSMDGDHAAAMRYTEAKLRAVSEELLFDLEKETVNFIPNYDGTQKEPQVLPAKLPNLLLNGTMGIAVGMATKIPPHNLTELCDAIFHFIDNPECTASDLFEIVPGPDFPTGGIIYDQKEIKLAYTTGKGKIVMRGKTEIVEEKSGKFRIIINEVPYQVNKASMLEKIAELVKTKKLEGIRDVRDESDKDGVRVVVELKKDAYPKKVLNRLFKLTQLQSNFDVNMLALVDGIQPKVLNLRDILEHYVNHRKTVVRKRAEFELRKAEERAHILEGLKMALDKIDAIIKVIKASKDKNIAKENLMSKFKFSELQAIAILEMRLQNLANLERQKIEDELKEKQRIIKELKELLASAKKILQVIKDELQEIKEKFGDERKTKIIKGAVGEFSQEDLVPNEPTIVMMTQDGYIKRMPTDTFKSQHRGGKGVIGLTTKEEDSVENLLSPMTHDNLFFFTTRGRVFQLKAYDVPVSTRTSKGNSIVNFLQLAPNEKVSSILPLPAKIEESDAKFIFMSTQKGVIKKVPLEDFKNVRRSGLIAIKLKAEDRLDWVSTTAGTNEMMLISARGQAIRFKESDVRAMGRAASGVRGIRLKADDTVVSMRKIDPKKEKESQVSVISQEGFGKRTELKHYKVQNRGGGGIRTQKVTSKTGQVVKGFVVDSEEVKGQDLLIISEKGQVIRLPFKSIPVLGRDTQGVRVMRFKQKGDKVASLSPLESAKEE
jgi:DNA gyrase subunit A